MEKINRFNLDIALFNRELNEFIESVNEIDNETNNLLIETVIAVDRLQIKSKFREISSSHQNNFALNLDDEIFECRRYIVCRLCHENIPLCAEDFESHIQKKSHKEREISLKTTRKSINDSGYDSVLTTNRTSINEVNNLNHEQSTESNTNSSVDAQSSCSSCGMSQPISVDSLRSVSENVCVSRKLENVIQPEIIFKAISTKFIEITTRTEDRIRSETKIISLLTRCLGLFDSTSKISRIGSSTYGFGGPKTNFNVIVNTSQNPISALHSFEKILKASDVQMKFEAITTINCDRVQRRRLQAIHKESRILCVMHFSSNHEMAESSQVIRDAIVHTPLCFHLIAYIKCWQDALNEVAAQNGMCAFQFNTYIIAVLVIFYLQYNKKFPKLKELPASQTRFIHTLSDVSEVNVKQAIWEFFEFYGKKYEPSNQMISIQIGRWQDLQFLTRKAETMNLTPEQKSWCDGILANGSDWKNCVMYVQDIKSPGKNIAAEISKEDANNFRMMCKMFSSDKTSDEVNVEYLLKLTSILSLDDVDPTKDTTRSCPTSLESPMSTESPENSMASSDRHDTGTVELIEKEMAQIRSPLFIETRQNNEIEIASAFKNHFREFDPAINVEICGSSSYGVMLLNSNFNLLIITNGRKPEDVCDFFYSNLEKTPISNQFRKIGKISANRAVCRQIHLIHIISGIHCTLLFDKDDSIIKSSKMIEPFTKEPLCNYLITYVKIWQTILNKKEIMRFQFNTYIISVLVIFFLQMNFKKSFPPVDHLLTTITSNISDFEPVLFEFFHFYGNRYQIWNHVISINIGEWQERRLQATQKNFSPAKKRLRNGIEASPENWKDCEMFVQDVVRPNINITAEIPKEAVEQFQQICKLITN